MEPVKIEAVVLGAGDVTEDALCRLPLANGGRAHMATQEADGGGDVGLGHLRTIDEFANEGGEKKALPPRGETRRSLEIDFACIGVVAE